jgi:thiamine transporter ThiT
MNTRNLVTIALAAGLSVGLSLLRVFEMPQGGSITLEGLPILYLAMWRGGNQGLAAGLISGIVQLLVRPFFVHPVQVLLDYPLAMAAFGVAGYFRTLTSRRVTEIGLSLFIGISFIAMAGVQWFELVRVSDTSRIVLASGGNVQTVLHTRPDTVFGDIEGDMLTLRTTTPPDTIRRLTAQGETARKWFSVGMNMVRAEQLNILVGTLLFLLALVGLYVLARYLAIGPIGLGVIAGCAGRFACNFLSGVVFFGAYAPAGQSVWIYSAIYNATYIIPQAAIYLIVLPSILRRLSNGTGDQSEGGSTMNS